MLFLAIVFAYVLLAFYMFLASTRVFPVFSGYPMSCFWSGVVPLAGRPSLGLSFSGGKFSFLLFSHFALRVFRPRHPFVIVWGFSGFFACMGVVFCMD